MSCLARIQTIHAYPTLGLKQKAWEIMFAWYILIKKTKNKQTNKSKKTKSAHILTLVRKITIPDVEA